MTFASDRLATSRSQSTQTFRKDGAMERSTRFKLLWTLWMTGGGIATGVVVYAITHSIGWTIVGVLACGVVSNAIGQALVQPVKAVRGVRRDADQHR
jgi:hypothetical protein